MKDYDDKLNSLIAIGEEWRIRVTREEFLAKIDWIREYEIEENKLKIFNDYHIQSSISKMISTMLMDGVTHEEALEQCRRLREQEIKLNEAEIPEIIEKLKRMKLPIKFNDILDLYSWLFYNQISLNDIPETILNVFKKTEHYKKIISMKEN